MVIWIFVKLINFSRKKFLFLYKEYLEPLWAHQCLRLVLLVYHYANENYFTEIASPFYRWRFFFYLHNKQSSVMLSLSTLECSSGVACQYHFVSIPTVERQSQFENSSVFLFMKLMTVFRNNLIMWKDYFLSGCINGQTVTNQVL